MQDYNELDLALLSGYVEGLGTEVVKKMIALYTEQSQLYLIDINQALVKQTQTTWQENCHKMKGAAGSVGLLTVHRLLASIEKIPDNWNEKQQELSRLTELNKARIADLNNWLATQ